MFHSKAKNHPDLAPWEQFCKTEARRTAHEFLEGVRRLQTSDPSCMEIPETVFATKFSAHFLDRVVDLTDVQTKALSNEEIDVGPRKEKKVSTSTSKSWWNIFRRRQSKEDRSMLANKRAVGNAAYQASARAAGVLEANVKILDLNSPTQSVSWQPCRLLLTSEQGNHQLEVYCPPKSTFPKMSLFCFLLEEVRSTTDLELPDSFSSFVVKVNNHGEYVFDVGGEAEKQEWIRAIQLYSSNLKHKPVANGHAKISMETVQMRNEKTRSKSASGVDQIHPAQHQRSVFLPHRTDPPSSERGAQPGVAGRPASRAHLKSFSASPSPCHSNGLRRLSSRSSSVSQCGGTASQDAENMGISTVNSIHCRPLRSSPRPRRALSMYEHGNHSQGRSSPLAGGSPPLPKRTQHSVSSLCEIANPPPAGLGEQPRLRSKVTSNPAIVTSSPTRSHHSSNHGNLETCSQNSSSSALHPVTLASTQRMKNGCSPSTTSLTAVGVTTPTSSPCRAACSQLSHAHTPSSPLTSVRPSGILGGSPSGSTNLSQDIEDEVRRAKQRFPSCDGMLDLDTSATGPRILSDTTESCGILSGGRKGVRGSASPPLGQRHVTKSPSTSPSVARRYSPSLNTYVEERGSQQTSLEAESEVIEVFPSCGSEAAAVLPCLPHRAKPRNLRFWSDTQADKVQVNILPSLASPRTPSPSTSHSSTSEGARSMQTSVTPPPIYIELEGSRSQLPANSPHAYQSWAVTHQDAQNLRVLSVFPWFHGMISRTSATQLVLMEGEANSGKYLVRQSETREGEFVLTFNYRGRAKHLRIVVDSSGCSVQHLFFPSVSNMIDYFKQNTIPLETCWTEEDCRITDHIHRSASDSFRTVTIINRSVLLSSPRMPRRSHSLHMALTQVVMASVQQQHHHQRNETTVDRGRMMVDGGRTRRQSSSLPQNSRHSTGWRQLFGRQQTLQRRHSENSSTLHTINNNYSTRN